MTSETESSNGSAPHEKYTPGLQQQLGAMADRAGEHRQEPVEEAFDTNGVFPAGYQDSLSPATAKGERPALDQVVMDAFVDRERQAPPPASRST